MVTTADGARMEDEEELLRLTSADKEWENDEELLIGLESFASDFYRSGTDWSCLNTKRQRTLRQTNLFQCWGQGRGLNHPQSTGTAPNTATRNKSLNTDFAAEKTKRHYPSIENPTHRGGGSLSGQQPHPRACPFYKKIHGTTFTVDAFRYGQINGCSAYFLSHFHADHYGGLNKAWSHGPIYCTALTARLVMMCLYVNPLIVRPLEIETEYLIEGIKVTMLEANHCPGAALIHFRLPDGQCHLHTGDFRASKQMQTYPTLVNSKVNMLYLDTTYCDQKYRFPPKEDVLNFVVRIANNHLERHLKTLIIVGAYSIGKECVYLAISKALGMKIYANSLRRRILLSFGWPEISDNLCMDGKETPLHVLPISSLKFEVLERYLKSCGSKYSNVLAFRPTGWTYSETIGNQLDLTRPRSKGNITIYGVPYSEHSSFTELQEFIQFLRPTKIIPTVNVGTAINRDKMQSYFQKWLKR
ncbi:hypothetical protein BUALT_Bualt06G0148600 [Buddleja alternifolia]|uniref:Metallo-beta-lactamase domain-containing protein n=1 Tax=Buddleja alternifolia TaxID=168488 RepID=A0AAV6XGQ5_9LAMI|nr:hypothetical protein BUALT_Bualt06G0148600 [Buddleja alternifolia]